MKKRFKLVDLDCANCAAKMEDAIKKLPGVVYCEALAERDGDATAFLIEAERGIDVRKPLFYALAERSYPLLGLEALGASLEDVFLSIIAKEGD